MHKDFPDETDQESGINKEALCALPVIGPVFEKLLKRGPKIPVIRLSGVIADHAMRRGGLSYARVSRLIDKAFSVPRAPAVALIINSPGGAPAQSQLIAGLIRAKAQEKNIPVLAFVEDVAASGGYWLACAGDEIFVQETSVLGSIGVISAGFGFDEFISAHKIKRRLYTSGSEKSMLDPFLPEKMTDIARLKEIQRQIHGHFIEWVKERRGGKLDGSDEDLFQGRFWTGNVAIDCGIADAVGNVHTTLRERYGEDVRFAEFAPDKKLPFPLSLLVGSFGDGKNASIGADLAGDILSTVENRTIWARFGF